MAHSTARRQIVLNSDDVRVFRSHLSEPTGSGLCFLPRDVGCILWEGYTNSRGYGYMKINERRHQVPAHHVAWTIEHGSVPTDPELVMDHLCQVPSCVSPAHLEWITFLENYRRIDGRSPVCRRGHPWRGLLPLYRADSQLRLCFRCLDEGKPKRRNHRTGKTNRMEWCPRGHSVAGDNGYDLPSLPGKRGCLICTHTWNATL